MNADDTRHGIAGVNADPDLVAIASRQPRESFYTGRAGDGADCVEATMIIIFVIIF